MIGSAKAHRGIVAKFVRGSGVGALVFDYSLAPEHPYPEGLNDSVTAYRYMLDEGIRPENIVFMGDSGGGNLCLATLLALKDQNIPLPAGAVTLSAWTDLKNTGESFITNAESDNLCWRDAQEIFSTYYCGDNDPGMPQISPLYGDLHGLPPLLMYAGSDELMRDDTTRFAVRSQRRRCGCDPACRRGHVPLLSCLCAAVPRSQSGDERDM